MKTLLLTFFLFIPLTTQAEARLGVIGAISESIYKDTDSNSALLPNIAYAGEHAYLRFPEIGYRFFPKHSLQNIAVGLSYESIKFDPDDSDDTSIRLLNDRDDSIMAFANYRLGPVSAKLAQDISGKHDGYYIKVSAGYPIPAGAWKVIPSISYQYMNSKMSNHLFGVSKAESAKTGGSISAYETGPIYKMQYGIRGIYPLSRNITFVIGVSYTKYDDQILKSPIVTDNTITSLLTGINYSF
ncbi:MipA/OmpV family protein [Marinomonas rhizomae]|uniref:Outer membrane protein n=1 Tax=Marinomonas rhizomae TaxID=491948 RepID=A0A366J3Y8_9GAMM|nr:MipA/OmpV family protein [Marinomonas rhizomae]RBP81753.1 outer membrane protein [Marinomonas rhizomae]RNF72879.1 MipA/OmpV family protein [Marinomonas rhizomae]